MAVNIGWFPNKPPKSREPRFLTNSSDYNEFLWETNEIFCFILIAFIHVYNNARDNRPRLTRSAILKPNLAPWER